MTTSTESDPHQRERAFYFAAWRWHFYAGIFVIPFLLMLTITGFFMLLDSKLSNQLGAAPRVVATGAALPPSAQAKAALDAVPGQLIQYTTPEAPDRPAYVVIRNPADAKPGMKPWEIPAKSVAVDPYTGEVTQVNSKTGTLYAWANDIHGTLLIGDLGDRLIEAAASLTLLLIATGLYMWKGAVLVALLLAMAFPMAGVALLAVTAVDLLLLSNLPRLKAALS